MGKRNMEKLAATAKIPTRYHMTYDEVVRLMDMCTTAQGRFDAVVMAFQFGFAQGRNCEKRKARA